MPDETSKIEALQQRCLELVKLTKDLAELHRPTQPHEDFMECEPCSKKSGAPVLCKACLHNRSLVHRLQAELRRFEHAGVAAPPSPDPALQAEPEGTDSTPRRRPACEQLLKKTQPWCHTAHETQLELIEMLCGEVQDGWRSLYYSRHHAAAALEAIPDLVRLLVQAHNRHETAVRRKDLPTDKLLGRELLIRLWTAADAWEKVRCWRGTSFTEALDLKEIVTAIRKMGVINEMEADSDPDMVPVHRSIWEMHRRLRRAALELVGPVVGRDSVLGLTEKLDELRVKLNKLCSAHASPDAGIATLKRSDVLAMATDMPHLLTSAREELRSLRNPKLDELVQLIASTTGIAFKLPDALDYAMNALQDLHALADRYRKPDEPMDTTTIVKRAVDLYDTHEQTRSTMYAYKRSTQAYGEELNRLADAYRKPDEQTVLFDVAVDRALEMQRARDESRKELLKTEKRCDKLEDERKSTAQLTELFKTLCKAHLRPGEDCLDAEAGVARAISLRHRYQRAALQNPQTPAAKLVADFFEKVDAFEVGSLIDYLDDIGQRDIDAGSPLPVAVAGAAATLFRALRPLAHPEPDPSADLTLRLALRRALEAETDEQKKDAEEAFLRAMNRLLATRYPDTAELP
jgi:hypothetical protein